MKLSAIVSAVGGEVVVEGDGLLLSCPAHADSHPSLRLDMKPDGKVLLACRAGCSIHDVMARAGLVFADLFDVELDMDVTPVVSSLGAPDVASRAVMAGVVADAQAELRSGNPAAVAALEYAERRFGVSPMNALNLGLGVSNGRLVVPFLDPGGVVSGYQGRDITESHPVRWLGPANPAGGGGWAKVGWFSGEYDEVVITEGPGDGLTASAVGYPVAMIRGAKLAAGVLDELVEGLRGRPAVVAVDSDAAGVLMASVLAEGLYAAGVAVFVVPVPFGAGDLSEAYESHPEQFKSEFPSAVASAERWYPPAEDAPEADGFIDVTHLGIACAFADWLGDSIKFVPSVGFHVYRSGVWVPDDMHLVRRRLHEFRDEYRARHSEAAARAFMMLGDGYVIGRVMTELEAVVAVPLDMFDTHADKLVVANGVVDLRSGVLSEHDPSLFMTKKVDVPYHPEVMSERWTDFLVDVFPDHDSLRSYMQRLIGYGITGETKEQCFGVLYGRGANGKSVFTDTLRDVFSGIATTTPFSTFEERASGGIPNDIAALRGARLVFASEGEAGKPMSEAVIKSVTGQDMITARFMRKEFFTFKPSFLILMASNHKPRFRSQDDGLWRRVKLIPWRRFFAPDERDKDIFVKMQLEAVGVLTWAVEGAKLWYESGLSDPNVVVEATAGFRENSDPLGGFFPEVVIPHPGSTVLGSEAYKAYIDWCDREELPPKSVWSRKALYDALEERGVDRKKMRAGATLLDVRLHSVLDRASVLPEQDSPAVEGLGDFK